MEHNIKKQSVSFLLLLLFNLNLLNLVWGNLTSSKDTESLDILIVVPVSTNSCTRLQPKWERGDEILPGAEIAVDEINDFPNLLSTYRLNIVPIQVELCNPLINIESFVENLTSGRNKVIGIVGYFCDNLVQFLSPLAGHDNFGVIQISAVPPISQNSDRKMPRFHHVLPSPLVLANVAAMLCNRLGLSQIGVVNSGLYHDKHYSKMAEAFLPVAKKHGISIVSYITNFPQRLNLTRIKESSARVYLVFLPPSEAVDVICNAYLQGFIWPYYAWVYMELESNEIVKSNQVCTEDMISAAKENIIFVNLNSWDNKNYSHVFSENSGNNYSTFTEAYTQKLKKPSCFHSNAYANILYDSVRAIALALHQSINGNFQKDSVTLVEEELSRLSFQGATGLLNFSQNPAAVQVTISLSQVSQGETIQIGAYSSSLDQLFLNSSKLEDVLSTKWEHVYLLYPPYLTFILCTLLILCLIFTTVTLSLFVHYRKTPKVKATSFILSLCMFIGCYSLIISSLLHTVSSSVVIEANLKVLRYAECWGNTFLFTVGIDLILVTIFAKTLRIYHIFNKFGKINSLWSDKGLLVLIFALVFVKVVLMIVWALVDINHLIDKVSPQPEGFPPHYVVVQKCYSHHLSWWITLVFGYTVALFIPILHVAILTRKIKRKEFNDSKAINTLVAIIFVLVCIGTALWFLLRMIGANIASKAVYSVGFSSTAVVCQIFLFVPKITPPTCTLKLARIKNRLKAAVAIGHSYKRIPQT